MIMKMNEQFYLLQNHGKSSIEDYILQTTSGEEKTCIQIEMVPSVPSLPAIEFTPSIDKVI